MNKISRTRDFAVLTSLLAGVGGLFPTGALAQSASPVAQVDALEGLFGKHAGARRSGAKGVCATGEFVGTADARALSTASAFSGRPVPVVVRFSVGGANPKAPDNAKSQRNLALQFNLPNGEQWQMGNILAPFFWRFVVRAVQFAGTGCDA